jgi:hypothetical protein
MKKTITALALLACANTFALSIDMEVKAFQKVLFEKTSSTTLEKIHTSLEVSATGVVKNNGETITISESQPAQYDRTKDMKIILVDKHSVRLIDSTDGIDEVVTAKVKKSFSGKIKDLVIDKDIYQSLYNKQLAAFGGGIFGQFGVETDSEAFSMELSLSDFDCIKEYDGLVECHQTLTFKMSGDDKSELSSLKEIESAISVVDSYLPRLDSDTSYGISSFITVLREVDNEIISSAGNSEATKKLNKIRSYIQSEITDSFNYSTIKGSSVKSILIEIRDALQTVKKLL